MAELGSMLAWTFSQEVAVPDDVQELLMKGKKRL